MLRAFCLTLLVLLLGACAAVPPIQEDRSQGQGEVRDFTLSGRLALRQPERSDLLLMEWRHQGERDRIALSTPLGSQVALLEEQPGHVRLTVPDRKPVEAADDDALMQSLLGYSLPVGELSAWVLGRVPQADAPGSTERGGTAATDAPAQPAGEAAAGTDRVQHFVQAGWSGSLQRWRPVGESSLPGLITVARQGLQLRLVVDQWTVVRGEQR
ncbi:MAG: outer membrane lipoprotein LolB [Pseudomonadota bacterium]|nr:outer membrane lipoprotein LolB [Pseudomonadota bacterium]